ncbi:MAG: tetratricopeptide repeat protein [Treponema sp.]|nr:tetratricopeptide repeat protein [Treponema sp.]
MSSKRPFASKAGFKRKQVLQNVLLAVIVLAFISSLPMLFLRIREHGGSDRRELQALFQSGAFERAFAQSREMLVERPLDFFLLTVNGFSAYQIAVSQINSFDTLSYINNAIWSLRRAMLLRQGASDGRIFYVLGKAYYHKGPAYADLAVKYLQKARAAGFAAADIPEYLGLAYAALRDFRGSVDAFALALAEEGREPSDVLLLSIARSYIMLEDVESAKRYLFRCLEVSRDSRTMTTARLLLGNILYQTGDVPGAEAEFLKIIEENGENAEASYRLGVLYASVGDITRARAEWRRALRVDPAHGPARARLN